jgi:hypothetical protein
MVRLAELIPVRLDRSRAFLPEAQPRGENK